MKENKKGYTLMIDALIALIFMLFIITTIYSMSFSRNAKTDIMSFKELHYVSEDVLDVLNKNGVLDNVSTGWAANSSRTSPEMISANKTAREYLEQMLPPGIGYNLTIEEGALSSTIAASDSSRPSLEDSSTGTHSTRVLVGYGSGKPTVAYSSRASLNAVSGGVLSRYIYFGGFEGQGNLTKFIELPDDAVIKGARMQLNSGENFTLYINGVQSGLYQIGDPGSLVATDIVLPFNNFHSGINWITLNFSGRNISAQYIGGGYLRVDYTTARWNDLPNFEIYDFPGIKGLINLYSSFYIPGKLSGQGMSVFLHYNHTISGGVNVYLDIGQYRVYNSSVTGVHTVTIDWDTLLNKTGNCNPKPCYCFTLAAVCPDGRAKCTCASGPLINEFSNKTIPFKLGTDTFTFSAGGDATADAILITDVSGSMGWCSLNSVWPDCDCTSASNTRCSSACCREKLPVAIDVDKIFVTNMLNYVGTKVGLVSYTTSLDDSYPLTGPSGELLLNNTIEGYTDLDSTCISCGINKSTDMLRVSGYKPLVSARSSWRYYVGTPPLDAGGRKWNNSAYTDSAWSSGNAILGYEPASTPPAVTTTTGSLYIYPNLWDMAADLPQPVDFTSGLNYTHPFAAPTFGMGATRNDGWDWAKGVYGGTTTSTVVTFNNHIQESGNWRIRVQAFGRESGTGRAASGAYGVQFNVTPAMRSCIVNGGTATLSFGYRTVATGLSNPEAYTIYARLNNSAGLQTYTVAGPSHDSIGWTTYSNVVTGKITTSGRYYLDFGPSITSTGAAGDNVQAYFDNVNLAITCPIPGIYFRKNFSVADPSLLSYAVMAILSDDHAEIYLNGKRVDNTSTHYRGAYWNRVIKVNSSYFVAGQNNIAVKLYNNDNTRAKFDLRLEYKNDSRKKAMLVMSDGMANMLLSGGSTGEGERLGSSVEAVNKACDARTYNISVYAVAFGSDADPATLTKIACWDCNECNPTDYDADTAPASCWLPGETYATCSRFYASSDSSELSEIYEAIAQQIAQSSLTLQMIKIDLGSVSLNNTLYPDSKMMFDIITTPTLTAGESLLTFESAELNSVSKGSFFVPDMTRPIDAKVTSYSGPYWTKTLRINSTNTLNQWETVYNLSKFNNIEYIRLGDPYAVNIPVENIGVGNNSVEMKTGADPADDHGGSPQDKVIYMVALRTLLGYSQPQKTNEGCNWTVEFFDGTKAYMPAPYTYTGPLKCSYNRSTYLAKKYGNQSAVNEAVYGLFRNLDKQPVNNPFPTLHDGDGRLDVKFNPNDVAIDTTTIGGVRSLWGPVRIKLILWM